MKKILLIALAIFTINTTAQAQKQKSQKGERLEKSQKMNRYKDFTPEEIAQLQTKKMTLELDLTDAQQKEVYKLLLTEAKDKKQMMDDRKAKREAYKSSGENRGKRKMLSKEERFNLENERLDKQIAHKKEMQRILKKEQFEKWEKMSKAMQRNKMAKKDKMKKVIAKKKNRKKTQNKD